MTKEEKAEYMKWYNAAGYKRKANRKYYLKNCDRLKAKREARKNAPPQQ